MDFLKRALALLMGLLAALLIATAALAASFPQFTGPVVDQAGMLNSETSSTLANLLQDYLNKTGNAVVVATVPSLEGQDIDSYAVGLFDAWNIGKADRDNGVLVVIARDDRKFRIEVGYGLESVLTDGRCGDILRDVMTPAFRQGDFDSGTVGAVKAIIRTISPDYSFDAYSLPTRSYSTSRRSSAGAGVFFIIFLLFIFLSAISSISSGRRHYRRGFSSTIGHLILYSLLFGDHDRRGGGGGGFGGGGFGGGGFGGGGFSGGGSSGGGGASGGW